MINIAVSIDRNYLQPLGVMLNSLLQNTTSLVEIHLIHSDLQDEHKALLDRVVRTYKYATINYYNVTPDRLEGFAVRGHLTSVSYYLFLLPEFLPSNLDKVLYLDPDMIVSSDIQPLWDVDLGDNLLAAVPVAPPYLHEMIVTEGQSYFNGGVLLINLAQWREENTTQEAFDAVVRLEQYILRGVNQDVLNVITRGRWEKLPLFWNKCPEYYLGKSTSIYSQEDLEQAKDPRGIIHFTGPIKPWHYACSHPKRNLYVRYKKGTPWETEPLDGKNIISFISRRMPLSFISWFAGKFAHTAFADKIKKIAFG